MKCFDVLIIEAGFAGLQFVRMLSRRGAKSSGGSFEKEFVFDVLTDVKGARLDMNNSGWTEKIPVDDEGSFLHKRHFSAYKQTTASFNFICVIRKDFD